MASLESVEVECPYCGESFEIEVETLEEPQEFIEDCQVCCRPIQFEAVSGKDGLQVTPSRSD
jgi:hypothetical protein